MPVLRISVAQIVFASLESSAMNRPLRVFNTQTLRQNAEQELHHEPQVSAETVETMSPELMQILIHELRVHQIELELQNEELRRTQAELDASRSRYFDLYDLAPVGYCTLNEHGFIVESNLTFCNLLGVTRNAMTTTTFSRFIEPEDQDKFYVHRHRLMISGKTESCELRLRQKDGTEIWVQLVSNIAQGADDAILQRIVLTDISAIKAAESALRIREEFHLSIFDSLSEHIAVLDEYGVIIAVNEAWRKYSRDNCGSAESTNPIGVNYLQLCNQAGKESGCDNSAQLLTGIRAVLEGRQTEFSMEYPCHAPDQKRWFSVHVTRMLGLRPGVVVSHLNVTNRKMAELAQEESHRELVLVANHVPGPVSRIDRNLRYLFANNHYQQFFGKSHDQVIGHQMIEVLGADLFRQVEPYVHRALAGEKVTFESVYWSLEGKVGYTLVNYVPDRDADQNVIGFFVVAIDITERKQAQEAKNEALQILQKVTSRVPGAVYQFRLRPDGRVSMPYSSVGLQNLFGVAPEDVREDAADVFTKVNPKDLPGIMESIKTSAREMTPWSHEYRFLIDGTEKWISGNSTPEREPDGSVLWHGFVTDVTERMEAEAARKSLESQLRESQKMEAIGTLAGGIAHDFNNALAAILGNAELAQKETDGNETLTQYLGEIYRSGTRARNLVRQILSYCRQQPTELRRLPLAAIVQDAMAMLRSTLPVRFSFSVHCAEEPSWILADKTQIEQVIINLVTNATQAIGNQSGTIDIGVELIRADAPELAICALPAGLFDNTCRVVRLSVSDDGPGIAPEIQDRIFEPFFTTKPLGEGTGLGLSVVQGIVKLHGASIHVDSAPGEGTKFSIYFPEVVDDTPVQPLEKEPYLQTPAADTAAAGTVAADTLAADNRNKPTKSRHVLLIDDDVSVLKISTFMLERVGYTVSAYDNPLAALDAVRNDPAAFQIVVTDYNMPVMPGLEIAAAVRKLCPNLPVAVTSGFVDDQLRSGAAREGVVELISKPFTVKELSAKIERALK
jgi:two-component system cell cycle sensor histidine kinase/response regulator CckA